jgi:subtilisin family serine protease
VAKVSRLLRCALPVLVALAAAAAFALPANAGQEARAAHRAGTPRPTSTAQPASTARPAAAPPRAAQWWLAALHLPQAQATATEEGAGITVAVLSTGVDPTHQDLSGAVTTGPDYTGSVRNASGPFWGFEGTAVAGLIAGHGHGAGGATGAAGVAPHARILSLQVTLEYNDPLNSSPALTRRLPNDIAAGIMYAVDHGARVIALPLDPGTLGPAHGGDPAAAGGSPAEREAVGFAIAHDVVLVAPAGDDGGSSDSITYPAAYPGVLAVGTTMRDGQLAPFTNMRSYVALTAPGAGLVVAAPGGGYDSLATTDMSAALAAGVAALIRSRFPGLTAAEVTQAIEHGVTAAPGRPPAPGTGHGALDAAGALAAAATIAPQAPTATAKPTAGQAARPGVPRATARQPGAGPLAGSLLRDAVIAAAALIACLAAALMLGAARRRRAVPARAPRPGYGGSHTRRPRAALPAGAGAGPRLAPPPAPGSLGPARGTRHLRRDDVTEPPWEPARPPGIAPRAIPLATARPAPRPAADGTSRADQQPPWELGELAAAPVPDDLPVSNTGPMYVWNPAASGPLPILEEGGPES